MKELIILGAGGHSLSVMDCVDREKYHIAGFVDKNKKGEYYSIPVISDRIEDIPNYKSCVYFVAIGDNAIRKRCFEEVKALGLETINIIDRSAVVSETAKLGTGNFIGKNAVVNAYAEIGDNNIINTKALIEHECKLKNHIHLSTNAVINGEVTVNDLAFIGSSSVVVCQKTIGSSAVIGAGSVVIKDVDSDVTVAGVPAKIIRSKNNA
ncbi:MAG: acetyltransferase [Eubacterium sp.]|nr:acetyltransferase [Eubacterium sp.]